MPKATFLLRIDGEVLDDFKTLADKVGMSQNGLYSKILGDFLGLVSGMSDAKLKEVLNSDA